MQYYKVLDLDCTVVSEKLRAFYLYNECFCKTFWTGFNTRVISKFCPELQEMFNPLGLTIKTVAFVKTLNPITDIHKDYTDYSARINVPVLNCEHTETKFYTTTAEPKIDLLGNGVTYLSYKEEDCTLVDSFCLSKPTVLRVHELHQVCSNNPNFPRVSCTIGFNEDLEHLFDN